jgi:hypothetical protein
VHLKKLNWRIKLKKNQQKEKEIKRMRARMRKKINFDLRKKLKSNKTLTKDPRIKMRNQKNKD